MNFVDIEFAASKESLFSVDEPNPFKNDIVWKRAKDIYTVNGAEPQVFVKEIEPSDIVQGEL